MVKINEHLSAVARELEPGGARATLRFTLWCVRALLPFEAYLHKASAGLPDVAGAVAQAERELAAGRAPAEMLSGFSRLSTQLSAAPGWDVFEVDEEEAVESYGALQLLEATLWLPKAAAGDTKAAAEAANTVVNAVDFEHSYHDRDRGPGEAALDELARAQLERARELLS
jgi:hypothetical protein